MVMEVKVTPALDRDETCRWDRFVQKLGEPAHGREAALDVPGSKDDRSGQPVRDSLRPVSWNARTGLRMDCSLALCGTAAGPSDQWHRVAVRERVQLRYLDSIAAWRQGLGYRLPAEYLIVAAERTLR
jgi:hypothetical protein